MTLYMCTRVLWFAAYMYERLSTCVGVRISENILNVLVEYER